MIFALILDMKVSKSIKNAFIEVFKDFLIEDTMYIITNDDIVVANGYGQATAAISNHKYEKVDYRKIIKDLNVKCICITDKHRSKFDKTIQRSSKYPFHLWHFAPSEKSTLPLSKHNPDITKELIVESLVEKV